MIPNIVYMFARLFTPYSPSNSELYFNKLKFCNINDSTCRIYDIIYLINSRIRRKFFIKFRIFKYFCFIMWLWNEVSNKRTASYFLVYMLKNDYLIRQPLCLYSDVFSYQINVHEMSYRSADKNSAVVGLSFFNVITLIPSLNAIFLPQFYTEHFTNYTFLLL